jgi:hypothetical protein
MVVNCLLTRIAFYDLKIFYSLAFRSDSIIRKAAILEFALVVHFIENLKGSQ